MSIDSGATREPLVLQPTKSATQTFTETGAADEPKGDHSGIARTQTWAELQVCDAISCVPVGRVLPPHLGSVSEAPKPPSSSTSKRIPWSRWMASRAKNHFVASLGEFTGTTMFLFLGFAGTDIVKVNSQPPANEIVKLLYISICFGFSLMVNAWIFFRISGALFNPAVTLAMLIVKALTPMRALCLFFAQLAGSIAASAMVIGVFPGSLHVNTTLSPTTSQTRGVFIEAFLTAELVFTILMLAKEKHRSTFMAPVGIGLALFISQMVGVYYTGASLNPARTFGPAVISNTWVSYQWIYWIGPMAGALLAVAFYKFIKLLEYEMANPGQDADVAHGMAGSEDQDGEDMQAHRSKRWLEKLGFVTHNEGGHGVDEEQALPGDAKESMSEPRTPRTMQDAGGPMVKPHAVAGDSTLTQPADGRP